MLECEIRKYEREGEMEDVLIIAEKRILLLSDLDWGTAILILVSSIQLLIHLQTSISFISSVIFPPIHPGLHVIQPEPTKSQTHLRNQNLITRCNTRCDSLALLIEATRSNGKHTRLIELLDAALWEEDAAGGLGLGLDALDEHAVEERGEGLDGFECGGLFIVST
jgi:hypothetical protein